MRLQTAANVEPYLNIATDFTEILTSSLESEDVDFEIIAFPDSYAPFVSKALVRSKIKDQVRKMYESSGDESNMRILEKYRPVWGKYLNAGDKSYEEILK